MAPITRAQKLGAFVAAAQKTFAARAATSGSYAQRSQQYKRISSALAAGARSALGSTGRVLHLLWLQVAGLFFFVFAFGFAAATVRQYREWSTDHGSGEKLALIAGFTVLFAWFGATSFWRAGKKQNGTK